MSRRAGSRAALRATWLATQISGRLSGRLAEPLVSALWFTPWRVPVGDRERARRAAWVGGAEPVKVTVEGVRLAGFARGDGPTVLLVHGWGEEAAALGAFLEPLAAAGLRAVALDLPGHGASGDAPKDLFSLGRTVAAAADALGAAGLLGHSMGGAVSVLARRAGADVDAVALIAPAVRLEHALDRFVATFRVPPKAARALRGRIDRRFGADVWVRTRADRDAPALAVPVLIVHDRDDPQIDLADAQLLAAAWPGARLVVTEGLGHTRVLRAPEVLAVVPRFFVDHLLAGGSGPLSDSGSRVAEG